MALFSKKDLGLFLPDDTPGDAVSLRHTASKNETEEYKPLEPKLDQSKRVSRYRPGQIPTFATSFEDDVGFVGRNQKKTKKKTPQTRKIVQSEILTTKSFKKTDLSDSGSCSEVEEEELKTNYTHTSESEEEEEESNKQLSEDSESDEEIDNRRQQLRAKLLEKQQQQKVEELPEISNRLGEPKKDSDSDSGSTEWETDTDASSSGDDAAQQQMLKPLFVPKSARQTILKQEQEALEAEKKRLQTAEKLENRKKESKLILAETIRREEEELLNSSNRTDNEMPDDTDGLDPEDEYKEWELRELRRIKREKDRREALQREIEETQRRREMTDEERRKEDERLGKNKPKPESNRKFMQKYYHKGVFYMDENSVVDKEDVRKRAADEPTLEDKFNKEMMPKVMQVKNFGKSGRTKYTHLVDQDTSQRDSLWAQKDSIREKYQSKMSGVGDVILPNGKKKKRKNP